MEGNNKNEKEFSGGVEFHKEAPVETPKEELSQMKDKPTETVGGIEFAKEKNEEEKIEAKEISAEKKVFRTMSADIGNRAGQKQGAALQAILKQERENKEAQKRRQTNLVFGLVSLVLFVSAVGIFFYATREEAPVEQKTQVVQRSIVYAENHNRIDTTNILPITLVSKISSKVSSGGSDIGEVTNLYFTKNIGDNKVQTLSSKEFLGAIQSSIPGAMINSLGKDFMLGVYSGDTVKPFLILEAPIRNTSSQMKIWESTLLQDMSRILDIEVMDTDLYIKPWQDVQIQNKNTRVLLDNESNLVLSYTYISDDLLVITTSQIAIQEILQRLATQF
ncbi:hypothetical protein GW765_01420 [Candidatus Parcubacteria bacterium]|nr:hypothetical protein [Candidatus Parcubacteria bacterium]